MNKLKLFVLCVCIYIQFQIHQCYATKCNRITFDDLVWRDKVVFIRTNLTNNGFPVFEDERGTGSYFTAGNRGFWYFSKGSIDYRTGFTGYFTETVVDMDELNTLGSTLMVLKYCPESERNKFGAACYGYAQRRGLTTIRCVPGMTDCGDRLVAYIQRDKRIIFRRDKTVDGKVYNNKEYRLYYSKSQWILRSTKTGLVINSVYSDASKPEYITKRWKYQTSARRLIECVGRYREQCTPSLCQNSGVCHTDSVGGFWCTCKQSYYGYYCGIKQKETTTATTTTTTTTTKSSISKPLTTDNWWYQDNQNGNKISSIDGKETLLKVLVIVIPLFLLCAHLCVSCIMREKTSCPRITSKHAYVGTKQRQDTETSLSLGRQGSGDNNEDEDDQSSRQDDQYVEPYFMSNRSKLPKGIQNMRSHLSEIDDVPLLVPLFTDCSAQAVTELTCIRQEYGDIVCCIGSSLNARNYTIFTQSDVSIALEPIPFQECNTRHAKRTGRVDDLNTSRDSELMTALGPLSLSATINSIACSLVCRRKDYFPITDLICEARRLLTGFQNLFLFLYSSQLSISLLLLLASIFALPPPLTGLNVLWLVCVVLPALGVSLVGTSADKNLMKVLTGKRTHSERKRKKMYKEVIKPFIHQFIPTFAINSLFIVVVVFPWLLYSLCQKEHGDRCTWLLGNSKANRSITDKHITWYGINAGSLYLAQDIVLFVLTISYVTLSTSFLNRTAVLWKQYPTINKPWCVTVIIVILLQIVYSFSSYHYWRSERLTSGIADIPLPIYFAVLGWLLFILLVSEMVKRRFIRNFKRFQKRERLKFDTKLGMNSPV